MTVAGNKRLMTIIGEEGTGDGNGESGRLGVQNRVGIMVNHLEKSGYSVTSDSRLVTAQSGIVTISVTRS